MSATAERLILDFADAGMAAYRRGALPEAVAELAVRLDLAGAGGLLAELVRLDFTASADDDKRDPKPTPTPKPPPPPPPPPPPDGAA